MNRRLFLLSCVAAAACRRPPPAPALPTTVPVVLVSLDTLRADRLGCYGYARRPTSPRLDALAADSVLFENHVAASPWTIPSHMSLLTSLWPTDHGVTGSLGRLSVDAASYATLSDARTTLAEALGNQGYAAAAFTAGETLEPSFGFGQGFAVYQTSMIKIDDANMAEMVRWVEGVRDRPFFLFWHTFEVHAPYLGTAFLSEVVGAERAGEIVRSIQPYRARLRVGTIHAARFEPMLRRRDAFSLGVCDALYDGSVLEADGGVGVLVDALKRLDLYDRSLVVVTSDHGEELGERSPDAFYNAHGHGVHREQVHVPLLVKLPGQEAAGTRVRAQSRMVDVMPTVLDVVRAMGPPEMQGESMRPLWERPGTAARVAFVEALDAPYEQKSVQDERYKYVVQVPAEVVAREGRAYVPEKPAWRRLFDLQRDPGETVDLLATAGAAHEALAVRMDSALRAHLVSRRPETNTEQLSPELIERLRSLGYVN